MDRTNEHPAAHLLAALPVRPRIGGRRMQVLSLGHVSILVALDVAFVTRGRFGLSDVLAAWDICRLPLPRARRLVGLFIRPAVTRRDAWARKWHIRRWKRLGRRIGAKGLAAWQDALTEYINNYFTLPPRWDAGPGSDPDHQTVPWPEYVADVLTTQTGISKEAALGLPVNEAMIRFLHLNELHGAKRLLTPHEQRFVAEAEAAMQGNSTEPETVAS